MYDDTVETCESHVRLDGQFPLSYWVGQQRNNPESYIMFDFGTVVIIEGISLRNGHNQNSLDRSTKDFKIDVSMDEENWTSVFSGTFMSNPTIVTSCPRAALEKFTFQKKVLAKTAKFIVLTYYGDGPALQYINFDYIQPEPKRCPKDILCPSRFYVYF